MYDILQLNDMLLPELKDIAEKMKVKGFKRLKKEDLVHAILDAQAVNPAAAKSISKTNEKEEKKAPVKRKRVVKKEECTC